jgi:hypothetical protein
VLQRQSHLAGDLWRALPVALALLCLLSTGVAMGQDAAPASDTPMVLEGPPPGALTGWGNLALRYLLVTAVCVCAFTLVFLKCWRDVSDGSPSDEGGEPDTQPAEAESISDAATAQPAAERPPSALATENQAAN